MSQKKRLTEEKGDQPPAKKAKKNPDGKGKSRKAVPKLPVLRNDYSQQFVDTGERPQNFIRERGREERLCEYPKLRRLICLKNELIEKHVTPPLYMNVDLKNLNLKQGLGHQFDVILVDPPWPEYVDRCCGLVDHGEAWTFDELANLRIQDVANHQSFLFLWVGSCEWSQGRELMKRWGFRRCEVISWLKTNKSLHTVENEEGVTKEFNSYDSFAHSGDGIVLQPTIEHCLMGIKGTVRRNTDGHIIHTNVDTDIIISENPPYGDTRKPVELYDIIERFCLGRKRLELFGESHNVRRGWVTIGNAVPKGSTYSPELYAEHFPDAKSRYLPFDSRIENLRPKGA